MIDQPQLMPMMSLNQAQVLIYPQPPPLNRSYNAWRQQHHHQQQFSAAKPPQSNTTRNNNNRNWKGNEKRNSLPILPLNGGQSSYNLPISQNQIRTKPRKFYQKKYHNARFAPYAPRNTTSFIIRAKKSGGITSLVSPSPVTPSVFPMPIFSPSREVLVDTAKEAWGVDGYGSMKGLIRLRSPGNDEDDDDEEEESDMEERVEVERRLDQDLTRFEMVCPNYSGVEYNNVLESRVDDQDVRIAQLEEDNLCLKERMFLVERNLEDLRRRMVFLETRHCVSEEVVENGLDNENDSDGMLDATRIGESTDYVNEEMNLKVNEEIEHKNEGRMNELVGGGVVSEKVEDASNELIMNEVIANKTGLMSSVVGTKNEDDFIEGEVKKMRAEDMVIACIERNESNVMKNEVETKIENDLNEFVQGQMNADKDEEMGTSCTENNNNAKPVKNEVDTKNEVMQGQMNTERDVELGIASTEKSIGVGGNSVPR